VQKERAEWRPSGADVVLMALVHDIFGENPPR
jgi:hypothetical protein